MSPELIAYLQQNSRAPAKQGKYVFQNGQYVDRQPTQQPQKKKGRGGFLSSLISEVGGAGGAAGGAAIGASLGSVVPGLGTAIGGLIGAGIGGFAGGTSGRLAENKIRDDQYNLGSAVKEGLLSGALSSAGQAFSLAKAGKAVTGEKGLANALKNISAGGSEQAARIGRVEGFGRGLKASGMGLAQGAQARGVQPLGAAQSDEFIKAITASTKKGGFGIPAGSPEAMQRALEPKLTNLTQQLTQKYASNNVPLSANEISKLSSSILKKVSTQGGLDQGATRYAQEQVLRLGKTKDINGLWDFAKNIEGVSSSLGKGSTAATTNKNAVINIIRGEIRPVLNTKVPGVATDNALYSSAKNANELLIKATKNQTGGGLVSRISTSQPVKAGETILGSKVESVGRALAGTGGPVTKVTNQMIRQAPASLGRAIYGATQAPEAPVEQDTGMQQGMDQGMAPDQSMSMGQGMGMDQAMGGMMGGMQQPEVYSQQAVMADIQRDPKNASTYLKLYETFTPKQPTSNIGKTSAAQYNLAQQGTNALTQLAGIIQRDPSVVTKSGVPGKSLPFVGGYVQGAAGTTEFDTLGYAAVSSLLRAQSGAAVPDSEVRAYMKAYLPRPGDSREAIDRKLSTLAYGFQTVMEGGGQQANQYAPNDLQSALMQTQGGF